jgi:hypothetical protein
VEARLHPTSASSRFFEADEEMQMKMSIGSITLAAVACAAVGLSAQAPRTEPAGPITVIGCVESAVQTLGGGAAKSDAKFVLTNVKSGKSASKDSPVGTSGSTSASPMASTYRLEGKESALTSEVGHQVEIVAVVSNQDSAASPTAGASATAPTPTLKVESVKMIAAACPDKH